MGIFAGVLQKIAEGIKDMSTLEVVNYKGTIQVASGDIPSDFNAILGQAKGQADFKITACTYVELDGDMKVFYDKDITQAEIQTHQELVDSAQKNRQAMVDLFKDAILKRI